MDFQAAVSAAAVEVHGKMNSKIKSICIIVLIYLVACFAGIYVFLILKDNSMLLRLFAGDVAATIVVWVFSVILKNSSVYDPYWSVLPIVLFAFLIFFEKAYRLEVLMLFLPVLYWGGRLTVNWAIMFENLGNQDWRYDKLKNDYPRFWQIINFSGIQLMPTIIVFLAIIPGILIVIPDSFDIILKPNILTVLAMCVCLIAPTIQLIADYQRYRFSKSNPGKVCNVGLWKYSRHPNYLGEILMWWGVFLILISMDPYLWWTGIGALLNNVLFTTISIPLMEKRQLSNKSDYKNYQIETSKLIPLPKKT